MAITGTKKPQESKTMKNYFLNKVMINNAEQIDSNYSDCSIKLSLTDIDNDYKYTLFINQNFEKDTAGNVTGLKFPDDLNRLFLHTKTDCNVTDDGLVDLEPLLNKNIAVVNYVSTGKYKRNCWRCVGSVDNLEALEKEFKASVEKGYPKDFANASSSNYAKALFEGRTEPAPTTEKDTLPF